MPYFRFQQHIRARYTKKDLFQGVNCIPLTHRRRESESTSDLVWSGCGQHGSRPLLAVLISLSVFRDPDHLQRGWQEWGGREGSQLAHFLLPRQYISQQEEGGAPQGRSSAGGGRGNRGRGSEDFSYAKSLDFEVYIFTHNVTIDNHEKTCL